MTILYLCRPGLRPDESFLGHCVDVPPHPSQDSFERLGLTADEALAAAREGEDALFVLLGVDRAFAGLGRPGSVQLVGLHDPSPWERRFVAWATRRVGVELDPGAWSLPPSGPFNQIAGGLADPIASWPAVPPAGLHTLEAGSPGLEARAIARRLRETLLAAPREQWPDLCESMLVLAPGSTSRRATLHRELQRAGIPVRVSLSTPLSETPLGRWLTALAALADWSEGPVSRDTLRTALGSPFAALGKGAWRGDLRRLVRALRRPTVDRSAWDAHVQAFFAARIARLGLGDLDEEQRATRTAELEARRGGISDFVQGIIQRLDDAREPAFFVRLAELIGAGDGGLRVGAKARTAEDASTASLLDRTQSLLFVLAACAIG